MLNTSQALYKRSFELDLLRGYAIVLMVIFHFCFDLTVFGWANFDFGQDLFWRSFRALIVSGFLLAVGMSSYMAYRHKVKIKKLALTTTKLVLVALGLTLFSLIMYPKAWIYFGIIHFIALALPISVLFVRIPNIALILAVLILIGYSSGSISMLPIWLWSVEHFRIPTKTVDLVSFIPWIAVVLIGVFVMSQQMFGISIKATAFTQAIATLGQHALLIYILHQPILYAVLASVAWLIQQ